MKNILSLSIALLVGVVTSQPVLAKDQRGGGGGGARFGGGGRAAMPAMARGGGMRPMAAPSFNAGRSMARVQAPSFNTGRSVARVQAPSFNAGRSIARAQMPTRSMAVQPLAQPQVATRGGRAGNYNTAGFTAARAQRGGTAGSPTIAFGGRSTRRGGGSFAPENVSRGWDRGQAHEWNHHRYGWRNNAWVTLDVDPYAYGYGGYPYGYDTGDTYADVSTSGVSLEASVQQALDDQGYNAGPADGVIGPQTRDAIASFQADHGLRATGQINDRLLSALRL